MSDGKSEAMEAMTVRTPETEADRIKLSLLAAYEWVSDYAFNAERNALEGAEEHMAAALFRIRRELGKLSE